MPLRLETLGASLEQKLQNEAEVLEVLLGAAQRNQDQPDLWAKLDAAAVRDDRTAELAFAYERLSRDKRVAKLPSALQADILSRIGAYFAESFGDPDGGEVYLQQALHLSPAHAAAFPRMETLLVKKQEGLRLSDLYAAAAPHKSDRRDQVAMLRRALEILEGFEEKAEADRRIKLYVQILKIDPTDAKTRRALEETYLKAGRVQEVAKLLEQALHSDANLTEPEAIGVRQRLIELYVDKLREPERAITHVEEILRLDPANDAGRKAGEQLLGHKVLGARAASALASAYERAGMAADAARCLGVEVDLLRGPKRIEAQKKLAALKFQKLGDLAGALALYEQITVLDPADDEVRDRFRSLSAALDKLGDSTRVLTRALAGAKEAPLRAKIGLEIGEIFLQIGDAKKARVAFQQVVDGTPEPGDLLRASRAIAKIAREAHDARGLAASLARVVEGTSDAAERTAASVERAETLEGLGDTASAIESWRAVLAGSADDRRALAALARLFEGSGATRDRAEILERIAGVETDAAARRDALVAAADLRAGALADRVYAMTLLRRAFETSGPSRAVHQRMLPLLEHDRRWEELARVIEADAALAPREERAGLFVRLGHLRLTRLADPAGAVKAYGFALSIDPAEKSARLALEKLAGLGASSPHAGTTQVSAAPPTMATNERDRLAALSLLEPSARAEGGVGWLRLLDLKSHLLEGIDERLSVLEEAFDSAERDSDAKRAIDFAARGLRIAVVDRLAGIGAWIDRVERAGRTLDAQRRAEAFAAALGEAEVNSAAMMDLARRTGDALVAAGDVARALPILRRALAFDPGAADLVEKIDALLRDQGSPTERIALFRALLQQPVEAARKQEILHAIGAIQRRDLGDLQGAIATYRQILTESPGDDTAADAILEALGEAGDHDALYRELSNRLSAARESARPGLWMRLADVAAAAGWSERAAEHYREALAAGAALSLERLPAVESLATSLSDAGLLRATLHLRIQNAASPEEESGWNERLAQHEAETAHDRRAAAAAYRRAAAIAESPLGDEARATTLYERALAFQPDDVIAAGRLVVLYERTPELWQSLPSAHDVLVRAAGTVEEAVRALALYEPAAIKARAAGAFSAAVAGVGKRYAPIPSELWRQVQAMLARVLAAEVERQDEAAAVFRAMVESAPSDAKKEMDSFEAFLQSVPETPARRADWRWLYEHRLRGLAPADVVRVLARWAADEERVGEMETALLLHERILGVDPNDDAALEMKSRLLLQRGDVVSGVEALVARRDRAEGSARMAIELQLAGLWIDALGRPDLALEAAGRVLDVVPSDAAAHAIVGRALLDPSTTAPAAAMLQRAAESAAEPDVAAALLRKLIQSPAITSDAFAERRVVWAEKLVDVLQDRPEEALAVAADAARAAPFAWSLWERAERGCREAGRADVVAAAYREAVSAGPAALDAESSFEELGRRAVDFQEEWFDDPEAVAALLRQMVEKIPGSGWAFERLKLHYNAAEQWDALFALYDQAIARADNATLRVDLLQDAASAAKDLAADAERLMTYLEALVDLRPDTRATTQLERLYERHGKTQKLASLLASQLSRMAPEAAQAQRLRIARLWLESAGDAKAALEVADQILRMEPDRPEAFELLERVVERAVAPEDAAGAAARARAAEMLAARYRRVDRPEALLRVLGIALSGANAPAERITLLREMVALRLSALGDERGAVDDMAALVVMEPDIPSHRAELARLAERAGQFDKLAAALAEAADRTSSLGLRAELLAGAADVHRDKLGDVDSAIRLQEHVLPIAEGNQELLRRTASELARLFVRAGRQADLCNVLERLAEIASDSAERREALRQVARIAMDELRDPARAARAMEARLKEDPNDREALDVLIEVLGETDRHADLAALLEQRAGQDPLDSARASDLVRAAALRSDRLKDAVGAIALLHRVSASPGAGIDVAEPLIALYEASAQWEALAVLLADQGARVTDPPRRAEILRRLGVVHRDHTGDMQGAVRSLAASCALGDARAPAELAAVLERVDPWSDQGRPIARAALDALHRTYTEQGAFTELAGLMPLRLAAAASPDEAVAVLVETASVQEARLRDTRAALETLLRAFATKPSEDLGAAVLRLVGTSGAHAVLAERLPELLSGASAAVPPPICRDLYAAVARFERDTRGDREAAEAAFVAALEADAHDIGLLEELVGLRRQQPDRALVGSLVRLAEARSDLSLLREAAEVSLRAAADREHARTIAADLRHRALRRWNEPPEDASSALLAAWAFRFLMHRAAEDDDRATVVALGLEAAKLPFGADEHRWFMLEAAASAPPDESIAIYARLFAENPGDTEAADRLFALHEARGDHGALIDLRAQQVEAATEPAVRGVLRLDWARRLAQAGRRSDAIRVLRDSLAEHADQRDTVAALAQWLDEDGQADALAALWEQEAARLEGAGARAEAIDAWQRAAEVAEHRTREPRRAIAAHRRAAHLGSLSAQTALARLFSAAGEHTETAAVLETLALRVAPGERTAVVLQLADAYLAANKPDRAKKALEDAAPNVPDPARIRTRLRDLYRDAGDLRPLAEMMASDARTTSDAELRRTLLREAASIHLGLGDAAQALPLLDEATRLAPDDLPLQLLRCRALGLSGSREDAMLGLKAIADRYGGRRPKERALVHHELARVLLASGETSKALFELDVALRIDPGHPEILELTGKTALSAGQLERAHRTYRAMLLVARRPADESHRSPSPETLSRAEILCELSDIAARQGDAERAVEYTESAFDTARESASEGARLLAALRRKGRPADLARAIETALARAEEGPGPAERARLWSELAALREGPLDRAGDAVVARLEALRLAPGAREHVHSALAACRRSGRVAEYTEAIEGRLAAEDALPGAVRIDLQLAMAEAFEHDLGRIDRAIAAYREVETSLSGDPGDARLMAAWMGLDRAFAKTSDFPGRMEVLEKRLRGVAGDERLAVQYALAELCLTRVQGALDERLADRAIDVLGEAVAADADLDRGERALRIAASQLPGGAQRARLGRTLEQLARAHDRPAALLEAWTLRLEAEPTFEAGVREAVSLASQLHQPAIAVDLLRRVIAEDEAGTPIARPLRAWARARLADLVEGKGDLREASLLRERAARYVDPAEERAILLRVARDAAGPLDDLPRATRIYEDLRMREPSDREVWEPLADVYRRLGDGARLAQLIEETVPLIDSPDERAALRLERARLALLEDSARAITLLEEVLDEDVNNAEAARLLADVLRRAGRNEDLAALWRRQTDAARDREDSRAVVELSMNLGALLEQTGDDEGALDVYHGALDWDAKSRDALRAVLRLSTKLESSVELGDALDKLLALETGDEAAVLALELADLRAAQRDTKGAEAALLQGLEKCPTNERLFRRLVERYTEDGDARSLADAYVRRSEALTEPSEKIGALCLAAEALRENAFDLQGAATLLERAVDADPSDREVLSALLDLLDGLGQPARAAAAVTKALAARPGETSLLMTRASLHRAAERPDLALKDLRNATHAGSDPARARELGDHISEAISRVSAGRALPEDLPERDLRLMSAELRAESGDIEGARTELSDLLRRDGKDRGALRALAAIEDSAARWDASSAVYRRLISLEEGEALINAALKLARACERAERLGDARGGLERALRVAPQHEGVREQLRRLYEATGAKIELGQMWVEDARAEARPDVRASLLVRAGRAFFEGGDATRAAPLLEEATSVAPGDPDATSLTAQVLAAAGRLADARTLLAQAAAAHKGRRSKSLGQLHLALSRIEQAAGHRAEALAAMLRAFDNDPQNADLAMDLGYFAWDVGDVETASRAFRAITLLRTSATGGADAATPAAKATAYYRLAVLAQQQGDRRKARFMAEKAIAEDPQHVEARAMLDRLRVV